VARVRWFPRRLRSRVTGLVALLLFLPSIVVGLSTLDDRGKVHRVTADAREALDAAQQIDPEALAQTYSVRVRRFALDGTPDGVWDNDHADRVGASLTHVVLGSAPLARHRQDHCDITYHDAIPPYSDYTGGFGGKQNISDHRPLFTYLWQAEPAPE